MNRHPPSWVRRYIGIPFVDRGRTLTGLDCWGLARLILGERFGVFVPSYMDDYEDCGRYDQMAEAITAHQDRWTQIQIGCERPGDLLLMRLRGRPLHVGVVVARGFMLHTDEQTDSVLESYSGPEWRNRVLGVYRHPALED